MSNMLSPTAAGSPPPSSGGQKIKRRNRIITSCLECRRRKLKCDRSHPCNHCTKAKRDCAFLAPSLDINSKNKLNQFKDSVESLEKNLVRPEDEGPFSEWNVAPPDYAYDQEEKPPRRPLSSQQERVPADEQGLEPSPLAVADIIYDDDGDDLIDDIGIQMGKVRITERIGGFVRPRFSEEIADTMRMNPNVEAPSFALEPTEGIPFSPPATSDDGSQSWLEPSADYLAPGLGTSVPFSDDVTMLSFLPSKDFSDKLLERYWVAVHPIARCVHRPSFEQQYQQFWQEVSRGFEPQSWMQALIFTMMFSASVSLLDEQAQETFRCPRTEMVRTFRVGSEYALAKSNVIRTTKTSTLQAFIMYLVPLCRAEVSRAHASLVTMAIRLAECAGFHRDGTSFGLAPVEVHVRRILWYQLCFLDIRVCEAVGPRPSIRPDEFDTKMPLNVDDQELGSLIAPKHDSARFTDMTLSRIRFECTEISRMIWRERPRIEKGENSLTALLRKTEEFKDRMTKKWIPLCDPNIPVQGFTILFLQQTFAKSHIGILHRYVVSTPQDCPKRLKRIVWASGAKHLHLCMEWDSSPIYKPLYSWYLGAVQQWHTALLFIPLVVTMKEPEPELDTVWKVLDYVFEFDPYLSRSEKMRLAFGVARKRLEELQKQRKARLPTSLEQRLGSATKKSPSPDRRPSNAMQHQMYAQDPRQRQGSQAFAGLEETNHSLSHDNKVNGNQQSFSYTGSVDVQASQAQAYSAHRAQPSSESMTGGQGAQPPPQYQNQFQNVDWEDFDRLFPLDESGNLYNPQLITPNDPSAGIPASDMQPMTFFPGAPTWPQQQQHQQSQSQPQWQY